MCWRGGASAEYFVTTAVERVRGMCGRLNVSEDPLARVFVLLTGQPYPGESSPNVTPTETVWVISHGDVQIAGPAEEADGPDNSAGPGNASDDLTCAAVAQPTPHRARPMRWWLVPYWLPDPKPKYAMFNARSDSLAKSRAFKGSFERRRCLVPVTGYYEWRNEDGAKLPSHVCAASGGALLLAGIWDRWRDPHQTIESFAIITTDVNAELAFLHDRQPLMLHEQDVARWMAPTTPLAEARELLRSDLPLDLVVTPVSTYVNSARNKGAQCLTATGNPRFVAANLC